MAVLEVVAEVRWLAVDHFLQHLPLFLSRCFAVARIDHTLLATQTPGHPGTTPLSHEPYRCQTSTES